jgi:caffeoyl-CoA O-methyltransferase
VDIVNDAINDYLLTHCTQPDQLLRDLAAETARRFPDSVIMQIAHDEGELLTTLTALTGARLAVEVGTFTGYSSICIARGLADGGRLIACDISGEWTDIAREYWKRADLSDRIDLRLAPAAETLAALPDEPVIDFAFIDADKVNYSGYYAELLPRVRPGGLLVLDNMLQAGRVVDPTADDQNVLAIRQVNDMIVSDERVRGVLLPVRDGVTIVRKI